MERRKEGRKEKAMKLNIKSPDMTKKSNKSSSLAKKLKNTPKRGNSGKKQKPRLSTLKSSSTNVQKDISKFQAPMLKKNNTSSPSKFLNSTKSNKKQSSNRLISKKQGLSELIAKKRKSGSHSRTKQILKDNSKHIKNSQNLGKNISSSKGINQDEEKIRKAKSGISKFNNYLNNKSTLVQKSKIIKKKKPELESDLLSKSAHHLLSKTLKPLFSPFLLSLLEKHRESLDGFFKLSKIHYNDPWVLACIGKCYTELTQHKKADLYFSRAFKPLPCLFQCSEDSELRNLTQDDEKFLSKHTPDRIFSRIQNIEFYSSCLWHLKKQQELCLLAHHCLENHFFRSETWIVLANTYSLNQDHETALQFLARALKIDPDNAYAFCLSGHEHACKENFEQAGNCYKNAINIDPRNVRAYWGLGNLSLKMEKFDTAIDYFMKALKINGKCFTFYTQIGIAFLNKNNLELALSYMKRGEEINPEDPFNRYNKAYVSDLISGFV